MSLKLGSWEDVFPCWKGAVRTNPLLLPYIGLGPENTSELEFAQYVENYAKTELHLHAEAAVWPEFYAKKNQEKSLFSDYNLPSLRAPFPDFRSFIEAWCDNLRLLQNSECYESLALAVAQRQSSQNITYSEVHFSPFDTYAPVQDTKNRTTSENFNLRSSIVAFLRGLSIAESRYSNCKIRAILDCVSVRPEHEFDRLYDILGDIFERGSSQEKLLRPYLVAVGLGGPEQPNLSEFHGVMLNRFRTLGLAVDIHAGEQIHITPSQHKMMLNNIKPDRVSHGIKGGSEGVYFDGHIALNPISNILTGSLENGFQNHPVKFFWESRKSFSINTDDPLLFGSTLTLEYVALRRAFGFDLEFFEYTQQQAKKAAFV